MARVSRQPHAVARQRRRGLPRVERLEPAPLVHRADHAVAQHGQPHRRGDGQEQRHAQGAPQRASEFVHAVARRAARNFRQRGRGDGHAEQPQRQLQEAEGVAQPAHRPVEHVPRGVRQAGGDVGVHHHVDLHGGVSQDGREHQPRDGAHAGVPRIPPRPERRSRRATGWAPATTTAARRRPPRRRPCIRSALAPICARW